MKSPGNDSQIRFFFLPNYTGFDEKVLIDLMDLWYLKTQVKGSRILFIKAIGSIK
jgi:ubiquitin